MKLGNTQEIQKFYQENGYYIFKSVLPKNLIDDSLNEIDVILKDQWSLFFSEEKYPGKDKAIVRLFARNRHYRRILYEWLNKRTLTPYNFSRLDLVSEICDLFGMKSKMFQMAANRFHLPGENEFKTGSHQDVGIMTTESSITFWLPLIDATKANGTVKLWEKSHSEGVIVPDGIDYRGHSWISDNILNRYKEVWEDYSVGDLLVFDTKTVHTSMPNNSGNCRWAVIFRFDNGHDNKYFDIEENPLAIGYTMVEDKKSFSGFKAGK